MHLHVSDRPVGQYSLGDTRGTTEKLGKRHKRADLTVLAVLTCPLLVLKLSLALKPTLALVSSPALRAGAAPALLPAGVGMTDGGKS